MVAPAKILHEFIKDLETLKIRSAVVEGKKTDATGVVALAKLPGLPELRAKLLGMLNQPAGKLVRTARRARKPPRPPDQGQRQRLWRRQFIAVISFPQPFTGRTLLQRVKSR